MNNNNNGAFTIHIENESSNPEEQRTSEQQNSTLRSWRNNFNHLNFLRNGTFRSFITHSGNFRYTPLHTNDRYDNVNILLNQNQVHPEETSSNAENSTTNGENSTTSGENSTINISNQISANQQTDADDEDNNIISQVVIKVLSHFVRYLPFICILFVKFIHDHLLGIWDLILLHGIMYQINKTLRAQIAVFSQKSYKVLVRDFSLIAFVVAYRITLSQTAIDPFGLLINPPSESVTIEVTSNTKDESVHLTKTLNNYFSELISKNPLEGAAATPLPSTSMVNNNTVTITKAISLGVLLYYVAVNDLILKLLTILLKIAITMLPTKAIRHKPRARMYVLIEYTSQFYRALAPLHQWLMFFFESYYGLEVISGVLFSSFYMAAKGFEFVERFKALKKALVNFLRNMDYERKPTSSELDAAGAICPICHESYKAPVILECRHIFCDHCVSTWFKREQTCPMCRARISEDQTYQDGSTTFFYQLC